MKKFLLSVSLLGLLAAAPAHAAQLAVGAGISTGNAAALNQAAAIGNAAASSVGVVNQVGTSTGFAAQSPAGNVAAGVGANVTTGTIQNATVAGPGGTAAAAGALTNNIANIGAGLNLP
jgi:hypothetical protein